MNILQICKKTPIPPKDGEAIAIHQLTEMLSAKHQVSVLAMLTPKHSMQDEDSVYKVPNVIYHFIKITTEISLLGLLKNLFSNQPYITNRFYDKSFEAKLKEILQTQNFDFIHLEGLFPAIYLPTIRKFSSAKVVLRAHNVEFQIWERLAAHEKNFFKKIYLKMAMIPRLKKLEIEISQSVDALLPISPVDASFFESIRQSKANILTLPVGYQTFSTPQNNWCEPFNVGFIGGLDWLPNIEGLEWFVKQVWESFSVGKTNVNLNIAGRNLTESVASLASNNIHVVGEVENAQDFIAKQHIMLVPLFSGSGMRIKIIEAMAMGKCVLSTNIGAEGIAVNPNKDILLCNSSDDFLQALNQCFKDVNLLEQIGNAAIKTIAQKYNKEDLSNKLNQFYSQL